MGVLLDQDKYGPMALLGRVDFEGFSRPKTSNSPEVVFLVIGFVGLQPIE
jgi:hypothetical protein